jgi:polyhydroxybutyrate depolymerase
MPSGAFRCLWALCIFVVGIAASASAAGLQRITLTAGGLTRYYDLQVPTEGSNYPLLLVFHSGAVDPEWMEQTTGYADLAARQHFAVAFPAGTKSGLGTLLGRTEKYLVWNAGGCCSKAMQANINEEAFVRAVIQQITSAHPIDTHRIYLTGFSNGAMLVNVLAERLAGQIAAAGVAEGGAFGSIPPGHPVPMLIVHTVDDPTVPYAGGYSPNQIVAQNQSAPFLSVDNVVSGWVNRDVCRTRNSKANGGYTVTDYGNCTGGAAVTLMAVAQGGHHWLKSPIDDTTTIWSFLSRFSN